MKCKGVGEMIQYHMGTDIENAANVHMHVRWTLLLRATDTL